MQEQDNENYEEYEENELLKEECDDAWEDWSYYCGVGCDYE